MPASTQTGRKCVIDCFVKIGDPRTSLLLCFCESYFKRDLQIISTNFPRVIGFCQAPPIITFNANSLNLALSASIAAASTLACSRPLQMCPPLTPRTLDWLIPSSPPPTPLSAPPPASALSLPLPLSEAGAGAAPPPDVQCRDPRGSEAPWVTHRSSASFFCNLHQIVSFDPLEHVAPWSAPGGAWIRTWFFARS